MLALRHAVAALVVIVAGAILWTIGAFQGRKLAAEREFLTMRYEAPLEEYDALERAARYVPGLRAVAAWRAELHARRAESQYWLGRYSALTAPGNGDGDAGGVRGLRNPGLLMLAANAAYRQTALDIERSPAAAERLDEIAGLYLDALKTDPTLVDGAYNYELMIRLRETLARRRDAVPRGRSTAAAAAASVHGMPGAAPSDAGVSDLKIIIPQRPDERQQKPDAGRGGARVRKG
jgi:hypothetical protein